MNVEKIDRAVLLYKKLSALNYVVENLQKASKGTPSKVVKKRKSKQKVRPISETMGQEIGKRYNVSREFQEVFDELELDEVELFREKLNE